MIATRGMRVAVDSLHALDRLPGTREEVLSVANVLHVNPETSVFLGNRATEAEVRRFQSEAGAAARLRRVHPERAEVGEVALDPAGERRHLLVIEDLVGTPDCHRSDEMPAR